MRKSEHNQNLNKLLDVHKSNLQHLELQAAQHGGESQAPLHLVNSIRETREEIRKLEEHLRDLDSSPESVDSDPKRKSTRNRTTETRPSLWLSAAVIIVVACIGCVGTVLSGALPNLLDFVNVAKPNATTITPSEPPAIDLSQPTNTHQQSLTMEPSVTNTVSPTNTLPASETPQPISNTLLAETFDDNSRGWLLDSSTILADGKLSVTVHNGNRAWIELPNATTAGNYYIESEVILQAGHACFSAMGFAVGENQLSQNSFLFIGGCGDDQIGFYRNDTELSVIPINSVNLNRNIPYTIALRAKDGQYTFYINGKSFVPPPLSDNQGSKIAIFLWRPNSAFLPAKSTFLIDNVLLQSEP